jgi:hypothetical protein
MHIFVATVEPNLRISSLIISVEIVRIASERTPAFDAVRWLLETHHDARRLLDEWRRFGLKVSVDLAQIQMRRGNSRSNDSLPIILMRLSLQLNFGNRTPRNSGACTSVIHFRIPPCRFHTASLKQ